MKKYILMSAIISLLTACADTETKIDQRGSELQEKQIQPERPDITTAKEWNPANNCDPVRAKTLIGQRNLTEDQILSMSNAQVYRSVSPTEAVTDDLRLDRVTIVIDPKTKKIIGSDCG
ncbi:hypothetical protein [Acinetobacter radioresistens]|uniref:hypothetical protein n=1 Tax=Acinetobacter radioresistens TaxID=40216 RepID=UPI001D173C29|nr:hypothetical protein [Acinetobacter radioresistens]